MANENTSDFVVLLRVSTTKQGSDGNGIAAQRRDIQLFLDSQKNPRVVAEFVEVVSGASNERPILDQALAAARKSKCPLLVQQVSRLTRDVEILGKLTKDKSLEIKVAALPNADNFQIHLYGILAAQERLFVSQRTKAALKSWKERNPNKKLGNPKLAELNRTRKRQARVFAYKYAELIINLRKEQKTLREISDVLNRSGIKTRNGNQFNPVQVHRILKRTTAACA